MGIKEIGRLMNKTRDKEKGSRLGLFLDYKRILKDDAAFLVKGLMHANAVLLTCFPRYHGQFMWRYGPFD